jgi:tRNA-intron endonuclease
VKHNREVIAREKSITSKIFLSRNCESIKESKQMHEESANSTMGLELKTVGNLSRKGVTVTDKSTIGALTQRGFGTEEKGILTLNFYESLFLLEKQVLQIRKEKDNLIDFEEVLRRYEEIDENAWIHFMIYRDLRSRGYVVREGFGVAIDFRLYERGSYGKDTATFLVLSTQEGKPMSMDQLTNALFQAQSLKKELVLAVMNRRGEIVYYSVSTLRFN